MSSDIETVQTAYGDVDVEVVDCDSCGATIAKDDASDFTLGDRHGFACDHCVGEGPIGFPDPERVPFLTRFRGTCPGGCTFAMWVVWGWVLIPITLLDAQYAIEESDSTSMRFTQGVAWTVVVLTLYAIVSLWLMRLIP